MVEYQEMISRSYDLLCRIDDLRYEIHKYELEYPQRSYDLRQTKVAYEEYTNSKIAIFFDKLSGKYDDKLTQLTQLYRAAQAAHSTCKYNLDSSKAKLAALESEYETAPTRAVLFARFPNDEFLKKQDAYYSANALLPLLEETQQHLTSARDWAENRNADFKPLGTQYDKSLALKNASTSALKAFHLMETIQSDGFQMEIHPYFQNPSGFIASAARQYGQLDRINYALDAVRKAIQSVNTLRKTLEDHR